MAAQSSLSMLLFRADAPRRAKSLLINNIIAIESYVKKVTFKKFHCPSGKIWTSSKMFSHQKCIKQKTFVLQISSMGYYTYSIIIINYYRAIRQRQVSHVSAAIWHLSRATARTEIWHTGRKILTAAVTIAEIGELGREDKEELTWWTRGHCGKHFPRSSASKIGAIGW